MAKLDLIFIVAWAIDQKIIAVKFLIAIRNKKRYHLSCISWYYKILRQFVFVNGKWVLIVTLCLLSGY